MRAASPSSPNPGGPGFSLDDMPVPMVYATHRIIRDCNAEFAALFGFERADLVDRSFSRLYPDLADFIRTGRMWRSGLAGGQVFDDARLMADAGGRRFWCRVRGRSRNAADPFAAALYCFEPMARAPNAMAMTLTGRQRQILTLVAQGKTSQSIADEIGLSRRTVEAHRLRLVKAAGVRNGAELVAWFLASVPEAGEAGTHRLR